MRVRASLVVAGASRGRPDARQQYRPGVSLMFRALCWIALFSATPFMAFAGPGPLPDTVLTGALTGEDNQTWRLVPFVVPAGVTRITVDFDYTTRDERTTIDLGVLGPEGFRGWSGGNKQSFTISVSDATPSYLPGPIHEG